MRALLVAYWAIFLAVGCSVAEAEPSHTDQLISDLEGSDQAAQLEAADSLGAMPQEASKAVPALIKALGSDNATVRWHAARALGELRAASDKAVPELTKALSDSDPTVQAHAAYALGEIGAGAMPSVEALMKTATHSEPSVRRAALGALRKIRPDPKMALPMMAKVLEEGDPASIANALHTLAEGGADSVPILIKALDHPKARYWACLALAEIGPPAKDAVPGLTEALKDKDPETRSQAAIALAEIGPDSKSAVPALIDALGDEQASVRYGAALALGKIGDPSAIEAIEKISGDDKFLELIAVWSLAKLNPKDAKAQEEAVTKLVAALESDNPHMRQLAARSLFELKADPAQIGPALVAAMQGADPETVEHMYQAMASLGPKIVPRLRERLKAGVEHPMPIHAVRILALLGPDAKEAVPELTEALEKADNDPEFTKAVLMALGRIGPDSAPAIPAIAKELTSKDMPVQYAACYALGKIGPAAANSCTGELCKNLESEDTFLRMCSGWALLHINPDNKELRAQALPKLIEALEHGDVRVRMEAAITLGELGPEAASAVPALTKLQNDPDVMVRKAAEDAVQKIQKP